MDCSGALETELKRAKEPLDCHALFERQSVREFTDSVNRVSDYLGHLWRKGKALRIPAPSSDTSRARWLYVYKPPIKKPRPSLIEAVEAAQGKKLLRKSIEHRGEPPHVRFLTTSGATPEMYVHEITDEIITGTVSASGRGQVPADLLARCVIGIAWLDAQS